MINIIWHVYLLECSDQTYYCGITNDISARIAKHNAGKGSKYCKARLPVKLLISKECSSKSEALKLEYKIKQLPKQEKQNALKTI